MHNFTLFNTKSMEYSDFYSWRYTSSESDLIRSKALNYNRKHHEISGQSLFHGIPFINMFESCNENSSQKVLSLPELIVHKYGKSFDVIHDSMAASFGCLDIKNKTWLTNDLKYIYPNVNLILPKVFGNDEVPLIGEIKIKSNKINVFGGFGDLQTALFGAQISNEDIKILQKFYDKVFYDQNFRSNIENINTDMKENKYVNIIIDFINSDKKRPISLPINSK